MILRQYFNDRITGQKYMPDIMVDLTNNWCRILLIGITATNCLAAPYDSCHDEIEWGRLPPLPCEIQVIVQINN